MSARLPRPPAARQRHDDLAAPLFDDLDGDDSERPAYRDLADEAEDALPLTANVRGLRAVETP